MELGQPGSHLVHGGVGVAVFIDEAVVLDFEAEVVDAVGDRVDEGFTAVLQVAAVVLDKVEPGLFGAFVVAVQGRPFRQPVLSNPRVHRDHFGRREKAVCGSTGGGGRFHDDLVHPVGGGGAAEQIGGGVGAGQPGIGEDRVDELIESGARGAGHGRGQHGVAASFGV